MIACRLSGGQRYFRSSPARFEARLIGMPGSAFTSAIEQVFTLKPWRC